MTNVPASLVLWTLAGLALLAIGRLCVAYRTAIRAARARVASGSSVAHTRCGPIEYARLGSGSPVLLVHGAGGGYDQSLDFAAPLAQRGAMLVAMSRFGYLRTPLPPDASAAAQADAHACLLDALGVARAAVIGASAGAPSAMQFALRHPERCSALVLLVPAAYVARHCAPPIRPPKGIGFLLATALRSDFLFWLASRLSPAILVGSILGTPPDVVATASASEQARVTSVIEHLLPLSLRRAGLLNDASVVSSLERSDLEHIAAPVLAISVEDDRYGTFGPARYTAEHIPGARFVGFPTGGHLWVGHHEDIAVRIADFLGL